MPRRTNQQITLYHAVQNGDIKTTGLLLEQGAIPTRAMVNLALEKGFAPIVDLLLQKIAPVATHPTNAKSNHDDESFFLIGQKVFDTFKDKEDQKEIIIHVPTEFSNNPKDVIDAILSAKDLLEISQSKNYLMEVKLAVNKHGAIFAFQIGNEGCYRLRTTIPFEITKEHEKKDAPKKGLWCSLDGSITADSPKSVLEQTINDMSITDLQKSIDLTNSLFGNNNLMASLTGSLANVNLEESSLKIEENQLHQSVAYVEDAEGNNCVIAVTEPVGHLLRDQSFVRTSSLPAGKMPTEIAIIFSGTGVPVNDNSAFDILRETFGRLGITVLHYSGISYYLNKKDNKRVNKHGGITAAGVDEIAQDAYIDLKEEIKNTNDEIKLYVYGQSRGGLSLGKLCRLIQDDLKLNKQIKSTVIAQDTVPGNSYWFGTAPGFAANTPEYSDLKECHHIVAGSIQVPMFFENSMIDTVGRWLPQEFPEKTQLTMEVQPGGHMSTQHMRPDSADIERVIQHDFHRFKEKRCFAVSWNTAALWLLHELQKRIETRQCSAEKYQEALLFLLKKLCVRPNNAIDCYQISHISTKNYLLKKNMTRKEMVDVIDEIRCDIYDFELKLHTAKCYGNLPLFVRTDPISVPPFSEISDNPFFKAIKDTNRRSHHDKGKCCVINPENANAFNAEHARLLAKKEQKKPEDYKMLIGCETKDPQLRKAQNPPSPAAQPNAAKFFNSDLNGISKNGPTTPSYRPQV